jgi:hypothetical protein
LAGVLVLGMLGLVGGLLRYWFIGISLKAQGWPGMIASAGASFLGLEMRPGGSYLTGRSACGTRRFGAEDGARVDKGNAASIE